MKNRAVWLMSLIPSLIVVFFCILPVIPNLDRNVLGPYGGIDPLLQAGLLEWTGSHLFDTDQWYQLPIFYPDDCSLSYMDSLLGQSLLIKPLAYFITTTALRYNLAFVVSVLLGISMMSLLWRNSGGGAIASSVVVVAMFGSPYFLSVLGQLNQLPPPMLFLAIAASFSALTNQSIVRRSLWWAVAFFAIIAQATFGWYGFIYSIIGVSVPVIWYFITDGDKKNFIKQNFILLPLVLLSMPLILKIAEPQLISKEAHSTFRRTIDEVRLDSADVQHFFERGPHRSGPSDWVGKGNQGDLRHIGKYRQVMNPGWLTLLLAVYGLMHRKKISSYIRKNGYALLLLGAVGIVFAFGDSVGVPGTDKRIILPFGILREMFDSMQAFRVVWRFSILMIIAVAWWAGVGFSVIFTRFGAKSFVIILAIVLFSIPVGLPVYAIPDCLNQASTADIETQNILSLPAPVNEVAEDRVEALWLLRAIKTNSKVTGGATGWVPPKVQDLRTKLQLCEAGLSDSFALLDSLRSNGITAFEIVNRKNDDSRIEYWTEVLLNYGATEVESGCELYSHWVIKKSAPIN